MDCYKKNPITTCLIGETRFSAGIFLSAKIAHRKKYGGYLTLTSYPSWHEAVAVFLEKYGACIDSDLISPNILYEVRPKNIYSVFFSPHYVGITYTASYFDTISFIGRNIDECFFSKHNMLYEDAINYARECFMRYWKNPNYYILQDFHLHSPISLAEVKNSLQRRRLT